MKKIIVFLVLTSALACVPFAQAALTNIGTASYSGVSYNLIFEGDLGGNGLVWLDYRYFYGRWQDHVDWAANVGTNFTITLNPAYRSNIDWTTGWRLPATVEAADNGWGYTGTTTGGMNNTASELGHLYYISLGNLSLYGTDGTHPQPGWTGMPNTGDFDHLYNSDIYWSGTNYSEQPQNAWTFYFYWGQQWYYDKSNPNHYSLAVRPGTVSATPVPGTLLLLGSGFAGLIGYARRRLNK